MSRIAVLCALFLLGGVLVFGHSGPDSARTAPAPDKQAKEEPVTVKLSKLKKFAEQQSDPKITLDEFIRDWEKVFGLDIEVNEEAFKAEGIADVLATSVFNKPMREKPVPIRVDRFFRACISRVPAPSGTTFVLRGNTIEITTNQAVRQQVWGTHPGPYLPLVHAAFERKSLTDALKDLAEQADFNIIVDVRAGKKARTAITAKFTNTPLDSAVTLLSDMAGLKVVQRDNILYVTTPKNAALWEASQKAAPRSPEAANVPRAENAK